MSIIGGTPVSGNITGGSNAIFTSINNSGTSTLSTVIINDSTDASSGGFGALQVKGGANVGKTLIAADGVFTDTKDSVSIGTGALQVAGGLGVQKTIWANIIQTFANIIAGTGLTVYGPGLFNYNIDSTSTTTGGVQIIGGLGVQKNLWAQTLNTPGNASIGGTLGVTGATNLAATTATTLSTSGVSTLNSASITNNAYIAGTLGVTGSTSLAGTTLTTLRSIDITDATSIGTGAVQVTGGLGVQKTIWANIIQTFANIVTGTGLTVNGQGLFNYNIDSTSTNTGGVQMLGGLGVMKTLYCNALNVSLLSTLTGRVTSPGGYTSSTGTITINSSTYTTVFTIPQIAAGCRGHISFISIINSSASMLTFYFEWTNAVTFASFTQIASSGNAQPSFPGLGPGGTQNMIAQLAGGTSLQLKTVAGTGLTQYDITYF